MGPSTGSEFWALVAGLALGIALSGGLRGGPGHRRLRGLLVGWGLNGAALALLGAVLTAGTEPGGLGVSWTHGWVPFVGATAAGTVGGRFPRAVGVPLVVVALGLGFTVARALDGFVPPESLPTLEVQPLSDRELVTVFVVQADWLELPPVPLVPRTLCRLRTTSAPPSDWWWPWAHQWGWARSTGAGVPGDVLKFGIYRLEVVDGAPTWRLAAPELEPGATEGT